MPRDVAAMVGLSAISEDGITDTFSKVSLFLVGLDPLQSLLKRLDRHAVPRGNVCEGLSADTPARALLFLPQFPLALFELPPHDRGHRLRDSAVVLPKRAAQLSHDDTADSG